MEESVILPKKLFPTEGPIDDIIVLDSPDKQKIFPPRDVHKRDDCDECHAQGIQPIEDLFPVLLDVDRLPRVQDAPPSINAPNLSCLSVSLPKARGRPAPDYKTLWRRGRWRIND